MKKIIIDANCVSIVFGGGREHRKINAAITGEKPRASVCLGGKIAQEYAQIKSLISLFGALQRAGRITIIPSSEVDDEERNVAKLDIRSDDPHVLALARISGARLLCSHDGELIKDFKDKDIIFRPRGKVIKDDRNIRAIYGR